MANLSTDEIKQLVAEKAVELVKEDMVIGIGSGSTITFFIIALGRRMKNGLKCMGVPTSSRTRELALQQGIPLLDLNEAVEINLTIDGADEVDQQLQLIKGGGGYLLQEKMVAAASQQFVVIADKNKIKPQLGEFPLPVEVIPYGWKQAKRRIEKLYGIETSLRQNNNKAYSTDHGHYILDCCFQKIPDPSQLNSSLHLIPGVVETGLFIDMCQEVIVGYPDGSTRVLTPKIH